MEEIGLQYLTLNIGTPFVECGAEFLVQENSVMAE